MNLQTILSEKVKEALRELYNITLDVVELQDTKKEFEGDLTIVLFSMLRYIKENPETIGKALGNYLVEHLPEVMRYNVVKGFLNVVIADAYYLHFFKTIKDEEHYGYSLPKGNGKAVMIEYSSPNTNKPLHLGHVRNNLLGYSVAELLKASGKKVYKTQIINDRGIHICKSMLAYQKYGNHEEPSEQLKGDKLVGNYYVRYNEEYEVELNRIRNLAEQAYDEFLKSKEQENPSIAQFKEVLIQNRKIEFNNNLFWAIGGVALASYLYQKSKDNKNIRPLADITTLATTALAISSIEIKDEYIKEYVKMENPFLSDLKRFEKFKDKDRREIIKELIEDYKKKSPLLQEAHEMLRKWEAGDDATVALWKKMNQWVYDGFEVTYKNLGVDFDSYYYESDTYLLGKGVVADGLKKGVFYTKEDGSVWIDLTDEGLDEKIVLRADGTAVYMTQDIGTAIQRVKDYPDVGGMVYTVGNEQDYHFKVLFLILKKLGFDWAENLYHLSYGMVDLPSGKMKSREGTTVDADELIKEMVTTAEEISKELGKLEGYSESEKQNLYRIIGLGALKYYILKVDPRKRIVFDPKASIDFNGNTGPFIQYTYARIQSILRKADVDYSEAVVELQLHNKEKGLLKQLQLFPQEIQKAASQYSPALIANYIYDLVKEFNSFYQSIPILGAENDSEKRFRLQLSKKVAEVIRSGFKLLGISVPERM